MSGCIWMFSQYLDDVDLEFASRDFITYKMGREYYGLGEKPMIRMAWESGAVFKIGKKVLIKKEIFEEYLRNHRQCLKDRVDYAKNGKKTEQGGYVSAYECNPEIVDQEFYSSRSEYLKDHRVAKGDVIAYQIRQSFKPGEITPEEANEIGYELASRFTKGNHAFIVATHTDKAHIHNHIIFNSTNLACDRKFKNFFLSSFVIQRISDGICLEYGLSVIKPKAYGQRSKRTDYPERPSYRDEIRKTIDVILEKKPKDLEEFLKLLEAEGNEIKRGKNIAIKRKEQNRFIRFCSLGDGYGEDDLIRIISGEKISDVRKSEKKNRFAHRYPRENISR